jgi:hypothetical protein
MEIAHAGAIAFNLLVAGLLTFVVGVIALVLMQRAILRHMSAVGPSRPFDVLTSDGPRQAAPIPLSLSVEKAEAVDDGPVRTILRRHLIAHTLAGLSYAAMAAPLLLVISGTELVALRVAVVAWAFAWPTVLVLGFLVGPDRAFQLRIVLAYFAVLVLLGAAAWTTPALAVGGVTVPGFLQPGLIWAIYAAPSLFLLLFLNRTIRTIGPLVLVFSFVLMLGTHVAASVLAFTTVRDAAVHVSVTSGVDGGTVLLAVMAAGLLAAMWPAWRSATFLRDRYAAKLSSDLLLTAGAIWSLQSLMLAFSLSREQGVAGSLVAAVPLLAWRLTLYAGLRPLNAEARKRPPTRLLLLRVFGFGRRSRRLLDLLGTRWRLLGSIDLIAAPDLASRTVEPSTFMEFVRGRLASLFIRSSDDLQMRLDAIDHRPDPDARFRINQLFCSDTMWKATVKELMEEASLVVMDLRGFSADRRGCVFELQALLDTVPLHRLVFLFDTTTDRPALESVLREHWQRLDARSPNLSPGTAALRLLEVTGSDVRAVQRLLTFVTAT